MFNESFIDILNGKDPLDVLIHTQKLDTTIENIPLIAPTLLQRMKRKQILIETTNDYYIAKDYQTNYIYICYRYLTCIDIDTKGYYILTDTVIKNHFNKFTDKCVSIYKTSNGYHVFDLTNKREYRSLDTMKFMLENFCDYYYAVFTYIRGSSVRLNKKYNESNTTSPVYEFLGNFGNTALIDSQLQNLTKLHYVLSDSYKHTFSL